MNRLTGGGDAVTGGGKIGMSWRDFLILMTLGAVWGASFLFMRVASPEFGPFALIAVRIGGAALCLSPLLLRLAVRRQVLDSWWKLTLSGVLGTTLPFVLLAYATLSLEAGFTSLLGACVPVFSALLGAIWLGERLGGQRMVGLLLGVAGMIVLVADRLDFAVGGDGLAITAALAACLGYAFGACFMKKYLRDLKPMVASVGSLMGASCFILPLGLWQMPEVNPSGLAWSYALGLAFVCTALAFVLFFGLLQRVGPTSATTVTFLVPFFGLGWGWWLLDEQITLRMLIGLALALSGTSLVTGFVGRR